MVYPPKPLRADVQEVSSGARQMTPGERQNFISFLKRACSNIYLFIGQTGGPDLSFGTGHRPFHYDHSNVIVHGVVIVERMLDESNDLHGMFIDVRGINFPVSTGHLGWLPECRDEIEML